MNFWEARAAALEGKKVQMIGTTRSAPYEPDMFRSMGYWTKSELDAEWEIVEEPKHKTYVVTIYKNYLAEPGGGLVDCRENGPPINQIAITVDEKCRLVSAKNVD